MEVGIGIFTDTHLTKKEVGSLALPGCDVAARCYRQDFVRCYRKDFARRVAVYGKLEGLPAPLSSIYTLDIQIFLRRTRDSHMRITGTGAR